MDAPWLARSMNAVPSYPSRTGKCGHSSEHSAGLVIFGSKAGQGLKTTMRPHGGQQCAAELRARGPLHLRRAMEIDQALQEWGGGMNTAAAKLDNALRYWPPAGSGVYSYWLIGGLTCRNRRDSGNGGGGPYHPTMPRPPSSCREVAAAIRKAYAETAGNSRGAVPAPANHLAKPKPLPMTREAFIRRGDAEKATVGAHRIGLGDRGAPAPAMRCLAWRVAAPQMNTYSWRAAWGGGGGCRATDAAD